MVHRDIKPHNLILSQRGKKHTVKILDFGLAKATREVKTDTGLTGAAVTALIDRLETLGYVTRGRDAADRRKVTVRAVGAKLREINRLYGGVRGGMEALLAKYDGAEFTAIIDFLTHATRILADESVNLAAEARPRKTRE